MKLIWLGCSLLFFILGAFCTQGMAAFEAPNFLYINMDSIRLGYEATFQNKKMADADDQGIFKTPYKLRKIHQFADAVVEEMNESPRDRYERLEKYLKPFIQLTFSKEIVLLNIEPGVIEVNQQPKSFGAIKKAWAPIFEAAEKVQLRASVYNLGSAGGGGHFHVGGASLEENPFIVHPLLLRNLLVYIHQHPSLLFAFSEANDLGENSTMQTLHELGLQKDFQNMIEAFDDWYDGASVSQRQSGLRTFFQYAKSYTPKLFDHNSFMNISHLESALIQGTNVKATVEWRNIRPMDNAEQVEAMAGLLLKELDRFSQPGLKVPFRFISEQEYRNFLGPAYTESDWNFVKNDLTVKDSRLDKLVYEYTRNKELIKTKYGKGWIREAYAPPEGEGFFEVVLPVDKNMSSQLDYKGGKFAAQSVQLGTNQYQSTVVPKDFILIQCKDILRLK